MPQTRTTPPPYSYEQHTPASIAAQFLPSLQLGGTKVSAANRGHQKQTYFCIRSRTLCRELAVTTDSVVRAPPDAGMAGVDDSEARDPCEGVVGDMDATTQHNMSH